MASLTQRPAAPRFCPLERRGNRPLAFTRFTEALGGPTIQYSGRRGSCHASNSSSPPPRQSWALRLGDVRARCPNGCPPSRLARRCNPCALNPIRRALTCGEPNGRVCQAGLRTADGSGHCARIHGPIHVLQHVWRHPDSHPGSQSSASGHDLGATASATEGKASQVRFPGPDSADSAAAGAADHHSQTAGGAASLGAIPAA
jgi:hypothetical protein